MKETAPQIPGDLELRSMRQFLMVAELLHFGRAAQSLGMTQPPLTQAIQKLEARLGASLFERTKRRVALSPAGAALVEPVRQLLAAAAGLPELAREAALGQAGSLRLGFVSTVGFGPLPSWLRSFRQRYPRMTVQLREATADVQLSALERKELDAAFVLDAAGVSASAVPNLERLSVGRESMVFAVPARMRPCGRRLSAGELLAQPLIIFPRQSAPSLHDAVLSFFHRNGAAPAIAQEAIQMQTIVNLVSAGLGIAMVPRVVATFRRAGVVYLPPPRVLHHPPRCETSLLWPTDAPPAVLRFVEHVQARP